MTGHSGFLLTRLMRGVTYKRRGYVWKIFISTHTPHARRDAKGLIGLYNNAKVKITNNVYNDKTDDHIIIKSSKAYAFAEGINGVEAYRPEKLFSDAVKGLNTFGGKMVRPKESYTIKAHKG